jgi:oxygen-independent coproporphyrinogen-3 oxidase
MLKNKYLLKNNCEINFELNPKEVNDNYINDLVSIGINRISIGIQSFDQKTLSVLERNHTDNDSLKAVKLLSSLDSVETTIDLIYGVMGQTVDSLKNDIELFCGSKINHLSLYQLTIEPNTIFYKKELLLPRDTLIEDMEVVAKKILTKNKFQQYEVSSWAKKNKFSKHNLNYWMYGDYIGVGPGAHSKVTSKKEIKRMVKLKAVKSYIENPTKTHDTHIDTNTYDIDLAMNLLRIKHGVSFEELENKSVYISDSFMHKRLDGINKQLLEEDGIKATDIGYKFLNDTVNLFS